ncbi:MAG: outer membrane beta-barrel protein [Salibacteraceae bacterium]|nr:outer membrane beta-barrel protein [Salibacteraceae bacterium]|tara:strand:+ start:64399 stop:65232 length:834 start_codon:yes stop_codon:yes gene_type:complete
MKTITLLIGLLICTSGAFAQKDSLKEKEPDTTKIKIGNSTVIILNNVDSDDYDFDFNSKDSSKTCKDDSDDNDMGLALDFGMAGYMTPSNSIALPVNQNLMELNSARSHSVGLTIMFKEARLAKERLYVRSGLGINWTKYHFKNNINISTSNDSTAFTMDSIRSFDKYKLRATYLQVPLLIGMRLGDLDNPLGIQFGVVGSYKIGSIIKQKYTLGETTMKEKTKDDFNLNPFKFEALARVSMDDFGFFAKYSLTELFESGRAPELYPFSIGITIGGF